MNRHATDRSRELRIFDSFADAEAQERREWMSMPRQERMILLEALRAETYPDERSASQGLQRILEVVD